MDELTEIHNDISDWVDYKLRILSMELDQKIESIGKVYLTNLAWAFVDIVGMDRANKVFDNLKKYNVKTNQA